MPGPIRISAMIGWSFITPGQLQFLRHLTILAHVEFLRSRLLFLAEFVLRRTAWTADYKADIDRVLVTHNAHLMHVATRDPVSYFG